MSDLGLRAMLRKLLPSKARIAIRHLLRGINLDRQIVAEAYLKGQGIEIGGLQSPLPVPRAARVGYVDRMSVAELKKQYPELNDQKLVQPDIIADGELPEPVPDLSQDFVIASHFLEHCQNPLLALRNMFRVLKPQGVLYLVIPDKRYTFDVDRPVTTIDHVLRDFEQGPAWSKRQHFAEWVKLVDKVEDEAERERTANELIEKGYSIHFHV